MYLGSVYRCDLQYNGTAFRRLLCSSRHCNKGSYSRCAFLFNKEGETYMHHDRFTSPDLFQLCVAYLAQQQTVCMAAMLDGRNSGTILHEKKHFISQTRKKKVFFLSSNVTTMQTIYTFTKVSLDFYAVSTTPKLLEITTQKYLITKRNSQADCRMVYDARKQSIAWMETDYSKHTYLGALGIMGETAL